MAYSPIQTSFAGGELSPRLRGRVDLDVYGKGLSYSENFMHLPHGPIVGRNGFEWIDELNADLGATPKIIPFRLAGQQDAILALGHLAMRIYKADGGQVQTMGAELVPPGGFPPWVRIAGNVDYNATDKSFYFLGGGESMRLTVNTLEAGSHRWALDSKNNSGGFSFGWETRFGSTPGGQELGRVTGWIGGAEWGAQTPRTIEIPGAMTVYITVTSTSHSVTAGWLRAMSFRSSLSTVALPAPWTSEQAHELQYASETGRDRMILVHPNVEPRIVTCVDGDATWDTQTLTQVMTAEATLASKPAEWAGTNWPGVIEIANGRSWWSGTPAERNKLWASKSGKPFDFLQASPVIASDAIIQTLATKGAIRWLRGAMHMLCGTEEGEHSIVASGGVLWQGDMDARSESAFGAAAEQAVHVGNKALFVSADRRKVRALGYDLQTNGWVQADLTFPGEHLTAGGIDEIHHCRNPHGTIILRVGDGFVAATYDEASQTLAWYRITTVGAVLSGGASNGPEGSALWIAVQRANGVMLERMWLSDRGDPVALDSQVMKGVEADGRIIGLDHLEGETVTVVIGTVVIAGLVVAAGAVQLDVEHAGGAATIGLPLPAMKAVTLPPEVVSRRGSSAGSKKRYAQIGVRLNRSAFPIVNGHRVPDRTPATPMDEGEPLFTGDVQIRNLGWEENGAITIEQDLPLRTEILAIFGDLQVNQT